MKLPRSRRGLFDKGLIVACVLGVIGIVGGTFVLAQRDANAPTPQSLTAPPTTAEPGAEVTTSTVGGVSEGLRVAAVGDIQPKGNSSNAAATAVEAAKSDLILGLGDYQYSDGDMAAYNAYFDKSWGPNVHKTYPVLAPNHDQYWEAGDALDYWNGAGASGYKAPVTLRPLKPYSFDRNGWHFVALPDACFRVDGCDPNAVTSWLRADLENSSAKCTIAYWHQPYFTSPTSGHEAYEKVKPWVEVLVDNRVDVLLQSHNHDYERFALQNDSRRANAKGIHAFVVGTGGIGFYDFEGTAPNSVTRQNDAYGVLHLTLGDGSYGWEFVRVGGESYSDRGSMTCR